MRGRGPWIHDPHHAGLPGVGQTERLGGRARHGDRVVRAGGRLILTNSRGEIVSVNPGDGAVGSTIETKTLFTLPPIVANSTLYTLDQKGKITAYR